MYERLPNSSTRFSVTRSVNYLVDDGTYTSPWSLLPKIKVLLTVKIIQVYTKFLGVD